MAASTKKTKKNKENKEIPNMKNKSKEYKILLLYDILATSDCLCSASPAYNTILQLHPNKNSNNLLTGCIEAGKKLLYLWLTKSTDCRLKGGAVGPPRL